jgi:hypothetical protein
VRFDASKSSKPSIRTFDVTTANLSPQPMTNTTCVMKNYTVIDDPASENPSIYRVAVEMFKMDGKNMHISCGTTNGKDAHGRFYRIIGHAKEIDRTRIRILDATDDVKADIQLVELRCIRLKLRKDSFGWYELVFVDVESRMKAKGAAEGNERDDSGRGQSWMWRWRLGKTRMSLRTSRMSLRTSRMRLRRR